MADAQAPKMLPPFWSYIITWPYFRALKYHTYLPAERILESDEQHLKHNVESWKETRLKELGSTMMAGTLSAAATIGVFSWPSIPGAFWLAEAFFYTSLLLSVTALVTAVQQMLVVQALSTTPGHGLRRSVRIILRCTPALEGDREHEASWSRTFEKSFASKMMVYVWQCPLMMMSYAWVTFLVALTVHVCTPLLRYRGWNDDVKTAIFYITAVVILYLNFVCSSAWLYWTPPLAPGERLSVAGDAETSNTDSQQGSSHHYEQMSGITGMTIKMG